MVLLNPVLVELLDAKPLGVLISVGLFASNLTIEAVIPATVPVKVGLFVGAKPPNVVAKSVDPNVILGVVILVLKTGLLSGAYVVSASLANTYGCKVVGKSDIMELVIVELVVK